MRRSRTVRYARGRDDGESRSLGLGSARNARAGPEGHSSRQLQGRRIFAVPWCRITGFVVEPQASAAISEEQQAQHARAHIETSTTGYQRRSQYVGSRSRELGA